MKFGNKIINTWHLVLRLTINYNVEKIWQYKRKRCSGWKRKRFSAIVSPLPPDKIYPGYGSIHSINKINMLWNILCILSCIVWIFIIDWSIHLLYLVQQCNFIGLSSFANNYIHKVFVRNSHIGLCAYVSARFSPNATPYTRVLLIRDGVAEYAMVHYKTCIEMPNLATRIYTATRQLLRPIAGRAEKREKVVTNEPQFQSALLSTAGKKKKVSINRL